MAGEEPCEEAPLEAAHGPTNFQAALTPAHLQDDDGVHCLQFRLGPY